RTAINKAWTSVSFRQSTLALAAETQAGKPMSGIRELPRVIAAGGGLPIEASGMVVGAIGISGAPGGEADQACAQAGIDAILADIEL
ncbi:MAG: GlcG/HbpS family heme-binding protein, partial [Quisquiliibacterium sp.]